MKNKEIQKDAPIRIVIAFVLLSAVCLAFAILASVESNKRIRAEKKIRDSAMNYEVRSGIRGMCDANLANFFALDDAFEYAKGKALDSEIWSNTSDRVVIRIYHHEYDLITAKGTEMKSDTLIYSIPPDQKTAEYEQAKKLTGEK